MDTEYEILSTSQQVKKVMEKACAPVMEAYGVRKAELDIMYFLAHAQGRDTAKDIINDRHLSKAHISKSVERLRSQGYLVFSEDEADHRCYHLQITQKALPVIRAYEQIRCQFMSCLFAGVTAEERECVKSVLKKMVNNVEAELKCGGKSHGQHEGKG